MLKLRRLLLSDIFWIILLSISIIWALVDTKLLIHKSILNPNTKEVKGIIKNYEINGDQLKVLISSKEDIQGTYYIKSSKEKEILIKDIKYGNKISAVGPLIVPLNNTLPNTFNYKEYLNNNGIYYLQNISQLTVEETHNPLYIIKNYITEKIENHPQTKNYLYTFILGSKKEINNDLYNKLQMNGVIHLFDVSGMHITLFAGIFLFILKKQTEFKKYLVINLFLLFYGFITLFPASLLRAGVFFWLSSINLIYYFNIKPINILLLTIVVNILINSFVIYDVGFLYSVVSVLGLLLMTDYINKGNYVLKLLKTTIVAIVFSLPITLYHFFTINIISLVANLIFVPLVTIVLYPLSLLIIFIPVLDKILVLIIIIIEAINNYLYEIKFLVINIPFNRFVFAIWYYILLFSFVFTKKKYIIFLIITELIFIKYLYLFDNHAYVYFLDVGQGDSSLMITPRQKQTIMIDTGGKTNYYKEAWRQSNNTYHISDNVIIFLKSIGLYKIDILILSHGDYDHMGESIGLVNNFKVENVVFNCGSYNNLEKDLIEVLNKKKIPYYSCINELNIYKYNLKFLNTKDYGNENDNSSVIYTEINRYKFLFMGDAGIEKEKDILDKYNLNDIDILKAGHHGSNTSSSEEFIDKINLKYSIISVGKNNRYGHPKNSVLDTLSNSAIYRTDKDGSIIFKTKNNKLKVKTCEP